MWFQEGPLGPLPANRSAQSTVATSLVQLTDYSLPTRAGFPTILRSLLKAHVFPPLNLNKTHSKVVFKQRFYHTEAESLVSLISICMIWPIQWR